MGILILNKKVFAVAMGTKCVLSISTVIEMNRNKIRVIQRLWGCQTLTVTSSFYSIVHSDPSYFATHILLFTILLTVDGQILNFLPN